MKKKMFLSLLALPVLLTSCSLNDIVQTGFPNVSETEIEQFKNPVTCFFYYDNLHYEYITFEKNSIIDLNTILPKRVPDNKEFSCWCTDKDRQYTYNHEEYGRLQIKNQLTLYAKYLNYYTVTYKNYDGSVLSEKKVIQGRECIYTNDVPIRNDKDGYIFKGWTGDYNYDSPVYQDRIFTADYDRFFKIQYLDGNNNVVATVANVSSSTDFINYDYTAKFEEMQISVPSKRPTSDSTYQYANYSLADINYDTAVVSVKPNFNRYYDKEINAVIDDTYLKKEQSIPFTTVQAVETFDGENYYYLDNLNEDIKNKYFAENTEAPLTSNCNNLVGMAKENDEIKEKFNYYELTANYGEEEILDIVPDNFHIDITANAIRTSFTNSSLDDAVFNRQSTINNGETTEISVSVQNYLKNNHQTENPTFNMNDIFVDFSLTSSATISPENLRINNQKVDDNVDTFAYEYSVNTFLPIEWNIVFLGNQFGPIYPYVNNNMLIDSTVPVTLKLYYKNKFTDETISKNYELQGHLIFKTYTVATEENGVIDGNSYQFNLKFDSTDDVFDFNVDTYFSFEDVSFITTSQAQEKDLISNKNNTYLINYSGRNDSGYSSKNHFTTERYDELHNGPLSTHGITWTIKNKNNEKITIKSGRIGNDLSFNGDIVFSKNILTDFNNTLFIKFDFDSSTLYGYSQVEILIEQNN